MSAELLTGREKKLTSWASLGILIFISAFLWAPSRDGLQIVYLFSFFLPICALFFYLPKPNEYLNYPTILALAYGAFSTFASLWGESSSFSFFLLQLAVLATWLAGASIVLSRTIQVNFERYTFWFLILGCFVTIVTIVYHYFITDNSKDIFRLVGLNVFRNPNEIGAMCGVLSLLGIIRAFQSPTIKSAFFYYALSSVGLVGVILSFSRAALLALAITSLLAFIVIRPPVKIWGVPLLMLMLVLGCFISLKGVPTNYLEGRGNIFSDRFAIWRNVIEASESHMLIGNGMSKETAIAVTNFGTLNHAHNAWIDTFYRTGAIGLCLILLHLLSVFITAFSNKKAMPLLLWLCFGCICSLFDGRSFFWEIGAKWFLYWIPAGLIVAYVNSKANLD